MERVCLAHLARVKGWKLSQDICDLAILMRPVSWRDQFDRPEARCYQYEPTAILRYAIIGTKDHPLFWVLRKVKSFVGKNGQEVAEDFVTLKFGDILHTHDVGHQLSDETTEVLKQVPFRVAMVLESLRIFRKRLAGRAADQNARVAFWVVTRQVAGRECTYAFLMKFRSGIIMFKGESAHAVDVIADRNIQARIQKSAS